MKEKIRFGFVGAGQIAYHSARDINKHEQAQGVACQDLNAERLNEFCDEFEIEKRYATVEELFSDQDVDAVSIAVPNKFHAPLAIQALEAGKHVILEKPFAMNLAQAKEVAQAAEKSGKVFMVGMNQRFAEEYQKIKYWVQEGLFGDIYHAKAFWLRRSGIPKLGTWFGNKELAGGGALYDIGVHMLDLCLHTIGNFEPVSVTGTTYTKFGNRQMGEGGWGISDREESVFDVDDFATALIKFKNGATVALDTSWACHMETKNENNVLIHGTEAGASLNPAKLFRYDAYRDYDVVEPVKAKIAMPHCSRFHNFINHILGEEELAVKVEEALVIQKILDGIEESSQSGREVRFDD